MSDQEDTQESSRELKAELDAIQPSKTARQSNKQRVTDALAGMAEREADRQEHAKMVSLAGKASVAFRKYHAKFGWTEAQFAEYWQLDRLRLLEKQSPWEKLLDRERKRVIAEGKPRKNDRPRDMTPEGAEAHRQKQWREATARRREKVAAEADTQAAAKGERLLTNEELAMIAAAEVAPVQTQDQAMVDLLASLRAAEEAEGNS